MILADSDIGGILSLDLLRLAPLLVPDGAIELLLFISYTGVKVSVSMPLPMIIIVIAIVVTIGKTSKGTP